MLISLMLAAAIVRGDLVPQRGGSGVILPPFVLWCVRPGAGNPPMLIANFSRDGRLNRDFFAPGDPIGDTGWTVVDVRRYGFRPFIVIVVRESDGVRVEMRWPAAPPH